MFPSNFFLAAWSTQVQKLFKLLLLLPSFESSFWRKQSLLCWERKMQKFKIFFSAMFFVRNLNENLLKCVFESDYIDPFICHFSFSMCCTNAKCSRHLMPILVEHKFNANFSRNRFFIMFTFLLLYVFVFKKMSTQ